MATQLIYFCVSGCCAWPHCGGVRTSTILLDIAASSWILAFGGFAGIYGPLLLGRPPTWGAGVTVHASPQTLAH